jgi:hypothetical protein
MSTYNRPDDLAGDTLMVLGVVAAIALIHEPSRLTGIWRFVLTVFFGTAVGVAYWKQRALKSQCERYETALREAGIDPSRV